MERLSIAKSSGTLNYSKDELKKINKENAKKIGELQNLLMADGSKSLLVIFQGMDASGKDGALKDVFKRINPAGVNVHSFKKPTKEELSYDFLWRVHKVVPAKGMIQIFNRSHYEDILVPSVEGFIPKDVIAKRYETINEFEKMLELNGTKILKFYLNVSKDRQLEKLTDRVKKKEKHWKHNDGDWEVREKWDSYMEVYETIFDKCSNIPWHIIPADNNKEKAYTISKAIIETLESMNLHFPELESDRF